MIKPKIGFFKEISQLRVPTARRATVKGTRFTSLACFFQTRSTAILTFHLGHLNHPFIWKKISYCS